ncbi:MAG TPA: hypothetical protein VIC05_00730 [Solirubrobacteraceae bacterium]|jgi:DNA repair ATPase RecN
MTPPKLDPLGLRSAPADAINAMRALPELVERLNDVADDTRSLQDIGTAIGEISKALNVLAQLGDKLELVVAVTEPLPESIQRIANDTAALPAMNEHLDELSPTTKVLSRMDKRLASIEAAMPVLVEVQQHLARLPDTIESLGSDLGSLSGLLERMLTSLDQLDSSVATLHASVEPLGRIANRWPGRGPKQ